MNFILSQEPATTINGKAYPGRVILDETSHGAVIGSFIGEAITKQVTIDGETFERVIKSAWCAAREKIDELKFYRDEGLGWFAREEKKVAA
jgi:hypothetical protein